MQRLSWKTYAIALLTSVLTIGIKLFLDRYIGNSYPFLLLLPAILISAWYGGLGPGLLATALTALAGDFLFLPPTRSVMLSGSNAVRVFAFVCAGILLSLLLEARRRAMELERRARAETEAERKQAESARAYLAAIVQSSEDAIVSKDLEGIVTSWNPAAEHIYGYTAEEMIGQSEARVIPPELPEELPTILRRIRAGERIEPYETFRLRKDGTRVHLSITVSPIRDSAANIIGASAIARDITEQKRFAKAVQESEFLYRSLADNMPHLVWMTLADGTVEYCNQRWYAYTGTKTAQEAYGALERGIHPDDRETVYAFWRRCQETGAAYEAEYRLFHAGREEFLWQLARAVPVRDEQGNILRWFGTSTDIDEPRQRMAEIEMLNTRLQRSIRETHHRVKNNLQIISAMLDMQAMQYETVVPVEEITRLRQHVKALATIHDLLTHQARHDTEVYTLPVRAAFQKLIPMLQPMTGGRPITYSVDDLSLPIRQVTTLTILVNELVSNAVKHGSGKIEVGLVREEAHAVLEVTNEGPGLPQGFEPMTAANTGLELVESLTRYDLAGSVQYENRLEGGVRVSICFPLVSSMRSAGEQ